jgi:hypothetical protein
MRADIEGSGFSDEIFIKKGRAAMTLPFLFLVRARLRPYLRCDHYFLQSINGIQNVRIRLILSIASDDPVILVRIAILGASVHLFDNST